MHTALSSELNVLATRLARIAAASRDTCDFTLNGLRDALVEVVASFPVYRSYVAQGQLSADDRRHIGWAVAVAKKHSPSADTGIFDFLQDVLTTDIARGRSASFRERVLAFAMKFQQFSSPVMAKGVEDTAFYRYHRLTSLNDVGGEPRRFGISVAAFHAATRARAARWPHNMLATSTHDSKRSEDVRARINVLSEMPAAWKLMLKRWSRINRGRKRVIDGVEAPSRNDEYLLYQTLIGTWPLELARQGGPGRLSRAHRGLHDQGLREAKEHSSWVKVNTDYEAAVSGFVQGLLAPGEKNLFLADFVPVAQPIARYGLINSLAQTLVKLASPGVPDIYQGCELWQFNLVDPDNRRPVDFDRRREQLAEVKALVDAPFAPVAATPETAGRRHGGRPHQALYPVAKPGLAQCLARGLPRRRLPAAHRTRRQPPCTSAPSPGAAATRSIIAVVPLLPARLLGERNALPLGPEVWGDTVVELPGELAGIAWRNVLTGEGYAADQTQPMSRLLASFPVALLASDAAA